MRHHLLLILLLSTLVTSLSAQIRQVEGPNPINFHHIKPSDGISDGIIFSATRDRYGFVWLGTQYGLNRYDGKSFRIYTARRGDTASLVDNYIRSTYCDREGRIWVGTGTQLCYFDYAIQGFRTLPSEQNVTIYEIRQDSLGAIWCATNQGIMKVDFQQRKLLPWKPAGPFPDSLLPRFVRYISPRKSGGWWMITQASPYILYPEQNRLEKISPTYQDGKTLFPFGIFSMADDSKGNTWVVTGTSNQGVHRFNSHMQLQESYAHFTNSYFTNLPFSPTINSLRKVMVDSKDRVWAISTFLGLSHYIPEKNDFVDYLHDPLDPNSLRVNHNIMLHEDNEGYIWVGSEGHGISHFHPDRNLFRCILPPFPNVLNISDNWSRASAEDSQGNIWFGTGYGLTRYNHQQKDWTFFLAQKSPDNVLFNNSIRSLLIDEGDKCWIGTARGLNRYDPKTGKMDFYGLTKKIPESFTWTLCKDFNNDIWVGNRHGIFRLDRQADTFMHFRNRKEWEPVYQNSVRVIKQDAARRLWIGTFGNGVYCYDTRKNTMLHFDSTTSVRLSENVITDFAFDRKGNTWIATEEGLTILNANLDSACYLTTENGLATNRTSAIHFDDLGRAWIGTTNGLSLFDASFKHLRNFDEQDGLLTAQFNEQSVGTLRDGRVVYPTLRGFVIFDPLSYSFTQSENPCFITSVRINGKTDSSLLYLEEKEQIRLRYNQNFLTLELAGLDYYNPGQIWYAYKLEPFESEWTYTQDPVITYTNIPGGNYVFHYKSTSNPGNWSISEKTLKIHVGTVFYKTWWFLAALAALIAAALFAFYRYRMVQQQRILLLQGRAQVLEKEKALVMYENLKQHLNPHFLFNSLTSLSSLIRIDPKMAVDFLDKMSKIYRYILKNRDTESVTLADEIRFVNQYIHLQKTRFQEGLQVHFDIDEEYLDKKIAPVTLQNLVENAIKHNLIDKDNPLVIKLYVDKDYLVVENNLQKKSFVETSNKQGLSNMRSLYQYMSREPLIIQETENTFIVKVPLL